MQLSDFDYQLPDVLIAQFPLARRDASRLLHFNSQTTAIKHLQFNQLLDLLQPNDLLVFNNTKVIKARLYGQKVTGGKLEILVERVLDDYHALAHIKSSKSPKVGSEIIIANQYRFVVIERQDSLFKLKLQAEMTIADLLEKHGHMPLPPYITRQDQLSDQDRYQTVYAQKDGAVAAPTAGLHFTDSLLNQIKDKGVSVGFVTLHVGAGTFQPIRVDSIKDHHMHHEMIEVDEVICKQVADCRQRGGRVIAVGTTSVRALESANVDGVVKPYQGDTDIFIYPGYHYKSVDGLITNFHLPKSSLLLLVSAMIGREALMAAYQQAIEQRYRFFSYGDAMVIL